MTRGGQGATIASTRLDGRVSLITGAAGGVGRAAALAVAANGSDIFLTDLPAHEEALIALSEHIGERFGVCAVCEVADISVRDQVHATVGTALSKFERIDNLLNCAGLFRHDLPVETVSESEWQKVMAINLDAVRHLVSAVLPTMVKQRRGAVVTVASDSAFDASPGEAPYGIAKMGAIRMMAYLAREYPHSGLRFNSIAPGWIRTAMTQEFWSNPKIASEAIAAVPAGRFSEPEEIAAVALFLVSDLASYVNGHCLVCDGGRLAGIPA